jgi:hypothetical protein
MCFTILVTHCRGIIKTCKSSLPSTGALPTQVELGRSKVIMSMAKLAANYLPTYVKEHKFLGVEMAKSFKSCIQSFSDFGRLFLYRGFGSLGGQ